MYEIPERIDAKAEPWVTARFESCGAINVPLAADYDAKLEGEKCVVASSPNGTSADEITLVPIKDRRHDGKDGERLEFMGGALAEIQGRGAGETKYSAIEVLSAAFNLTPDSYSLAEDGSIGLAKFVLLNQKKNFIHMIGSTHWVQYRVGKLTVLEGERRNVPGEFIAIVGNDDGFLYQAGYRMERGKFRGFLAALDSPPRPYDAATASSPPPTAPGALSSAASQRLPANSPPLGQSPH
jgi:hypothetical protein